MQKSTKILFISLSLYTSIALIDGSEEDKCLDSISKGEQCFIEHIAHLCHFT
ncbi:hypothetical protein [Bacillus sp. JJ722]|uniref:hypothetical protein n=1 Tax=Bacillus sp. JJ722 TaxID=3122973 RepID=UPI003000B3D9